MTLAYLPIPVSDAVCILCQWFVFYRHLSTPFLIPEKAGVLANSTYTYITLVHLNTPLTTIGL